MRTMYYIYNYILYICTEVVEGFRPDAVPARRGRRRARQGLVGGRPPSGVARTCAAAVCRSHAKKIDAVCRDERCAVCGEEGGWGREEQEERKR